MLAAPLRPCPKQLRCRVDCWGAERADFEYAKSRRVSVCLSSFSSFWFNILCEDLFWLGKSVRWVCCADMWRCFCSCSVCCCCCCCCCSCSCSPCCYQLLPVLHTQPPLCWLCDWLCSLRLQQSQIWRLDAATIGSMGLVATIGSMGRLYSYLPLPQKSAIHGCRILYTTLQNCRQTWDETSIFHMSYLPWN